MRDLKYIPAFHGLRAIACLAVFAVHLQQKSDVSGQVGAFDFGLLATNGNTGVCLFFMMSGFLLSLPFWLRDADQPAQRFEPVRYAAKRIGRIVPAYYLCLTALVLAGHANGTVDIALHYLFVHNFTDATVYSISDPFWTLAVQAQFYLLFPFVLLVLRPFIRAKAVAFVVLLAVCVGSYAAHASLLNWASTTEHWPIDPKILSPDEAAIRVSTLAHLPHFFLGMLAAAVFAGLMPSDELSSKQNEDGALPGHPINDVCFWLCAIGMLALLAVPNLDASWRFPTTTPDAKGHIDDTTMVGRYNFPYVPLLVAVMLITAPRCVIARRLLELPPLRGLGIISYGIYVYHLPCLGVVDKLLRGGETGTQSNAWVLASIGLVMSIAVASASYLLIERPLIRLTRRKRST